MLISYISILIQILNLIRFRSYPIDEQNLLLLNFFTQVTKGQKNGKFCLIFCDLKCNLLKVLGFFPRHGQCAQHGQPVA